MNKRVKEMLDDGFHRFKSGNIKQDKKTWEYAKSLYKGQNPFAVIIACSDSRTAPEILFDCGMGELFVVRTAGNIVSDQDLGSIEYAVAHLGVKDVVVMGHSYCGAVSAAFSTTRSGESAESPFLGKIIEDIEPSISEAGDDESVDDIAMRNIYHVIEAVKGRSTIVKDGVLNQKVKVYGCFYELKEGTLEWLDYPVEETV